MTIEIMQFNIENNLQEKSLQDLLIHQLATSQSIF